MQVLIPPGDVPLAGDEAQKCREFLDAIGLSDEEAALVHMDVGRTFYRQRCVPLLFTLLLRCPSMVSGHGFQQCSKDIRDTIAQLCRRCYLCDHMGANHCPSEILL